MSTSIREKLLDVAATHMGLKVDPVQQAQAEKQSLFKQRQAEQALALSKVARQAAYVGAGLTALSIVALTTYLLRRTISSRHVEG